MNITLEQHKALARLHNGEGSAADMALLTADTLARLTVIADATALACSPYLTRGPRRQPLNQCDNMNGVG